jgi:IclR family transcriptional regulator, carbohydrate utilization repressor
MLKRVRAYATRTGLASRTRFSITQVAALERELEGVRTRGIANDNEELEIGVRCIAAGIYDDAEHLVAGLSISAPADRLELAWADRVKATAGDISRALGHQAPAHTR